MKRLNQFFNDKIAMIIVIMFIISIFRSCGNDTKTINKKIEILTFKVDSLNRNILTNKDLKMEGLKTEKRMIQSTDRKILDVNRQSEIDKELEKLSK